MKEISLKARAKLNISLDVTEKRSDGYHNMLMVMQTVSLHDKLRISLDESGELKAFSNLRFIPGDQRNLAVKAAGRYLREIGRNDVGARINIEKRIPVGAGMGGGSADAAAVLRGMNTLFEGAVSEERLLEISADVGSDVPFCLMGGTALAEGRGEILSPLPPLPDCLFVICKPDFSISTPELFRKLDGCHRRRHPDTAGMIEALEKGDLGQVCRRMYNVFEDVDDRRMRTVQEIKSSLLDFGALGAMMTGTGSAVFGVFTNESAAEKACNELKSGYSFCCVAKPE